MSVVSEQVKKLRKISNSLELFPIHDFSETSRVIREAADTIESLSTKLAAANEQSLRQHRYAESLEAKINDMKLQIKGNEVEKELIQEMAEEIENLYGRETDLTELARDYLEDMEQSQVHCSDGWIYCGDGKNLPEEHDSMFAKFKGTDKWNGAMFEKTSDDVNVTVEFEDGKRKVKTLHTIDGKWNGGNRGVKFQVIAWKPLPTEYKENNLESSDSQ